MWIIRCLAAAISATLATQSGAGPQVDIRLLPGNDNASQSRRVGDTVASALALFTEWFGSFPHHQLTVVERGWGDAAAAAPPPGVIEYTSPWMASDTDRAMERDLIAGIAREYWVSKAGAEPGGQWFAEGVALYSAARGVHHLLEGRHPVTLRYFGGFLPLTVTTVTWSPSLPNRRPRIRSFVPVQTPDARAQRTALALQTLERYVGWPSFQQALEALRSQNLHSGADPVSRFNTILSEQRGRDMTWFFDEAFRFAATFDYGIEAFTSDLSAEARSAKVEASAGPPPGYVTSLRLRRYGDGIFTGTSEARKGPFASGRSLPVLIRFEDGSEIREWLDGREEAVTFQYASASPGIVASVDPDAVLLLDADRTNNTRGLQRQVSPAGVRMTLRWLFWLQDAMLAYSGLA